MKRILRIVITILAAILLTLASFFAYWFFRTNQAEVNKNIVVESWPITDDDFHNSNTDMIKWKDEIYIAFVSSPYHFSSEDSVLHVRHSSDYGKTWVEAVTFNPEGNDIRDPKLAVIGDRLFLYALNNTAFNPEPYQTIFSSSKDGIEWTPFQPIPNLDGWLFWRPKAYDGAFYNAAYWFEHNKAILIKSIDGINWEILSTINEGERNDETEIIFLADGRMLATARLEYDESSLDGALGDVRGSTLITISNPPFQSWTELTQSLITRLDGPYLFLYEDRVFAVGRYQPDLGKSGPLTTQGSALARKRTSLFEVRQDGLVYITDLPSNGDTSYVGLVMDQTYAYAAYYTNPITHDFPWIMGMFSPTEIRIAKINLDQMADFSELLPAK